MKVPFVGPAYDSRSKPTGYQSLINLYFEKNEGMQGEEGVYHGTPGSTTEVQANQSNVDRPVRGMLEGNSELFTVSGGYVGRLSYDPDTSIWTEENSIGSIPDGETPVSMAENGLQMAIGHSAGISVWDYTTETLTLVADSPVSSVLGYLDSYILAISTNGTFFWSDIGDASVIDGLSFASAEGAPDDLVSLIVDHRELWLFGEKTTEIWGSTGDAEQPFARTGNAFLEHGCIAKFSPAKINNTVVWLGRDANGDGIVFLASGYAPQRISTHALEYQFSTYATLEDAIGMTYQMEGHSFYVLSFPTADKSWQYDFATGLWSELAYKDPKTGQLHRHVANCNAFYKGLHLVGSRAVGFILSLHLDTYTDATIDSDYYSWFSGTAQTAIYRERSFTIPSTENKRLRHHSLELIAEYGVGLEFSVDGDGAFGINGQYPQVWLERSKDYGRTWQDLGARQLGAYGDFNRRAVWRRLGTHRHASYRLCMTDPVKCAWHGFIGEGSPNG